MSLRQGRLGMCFILEVMSFQWLLLTLVLHRFKGAYCSVWEKESLSELFGEMDVMDDTLPGMADKIIAHQASS